MIKVRGFRRVDAAHGVEAWAVATVQVPLALVLRHGIVSVWEHHRRAGTSRHGMDLGALPGVPPPARHIVTTEAGRRRFNGLLVGRRVDDLCDYIGKRVAPEPGTAVGRFLASRGRAVSDAGAIAQALNTPVSSDEDPELAGVWLRQGEDRVARSGGGVVLAGEEGGGVAIVIDRPLTFGGHVVPTRVWAWKQEEHVAWWDGRTFGVGAEWTEVPAKLRLLLERDGTAIAAPKRWLQPLADLRPSFLVRHPGARELKHGTIGAAPIAGVGILLDTNDPIRLVDGAGEPLPLRVIADRDEALSVIARCSDRVYVSHADALDLEAVPLADKPTWGVATLPFGMTA